MRSAVRGRIVSVNGERPKSSSVVTRERREHRPGRLGVVALIIGDHPIGESDERAELLLGQPARLAELDDARPEAFEGGSTAAAGAGASHERAEHRERIERRRTQGGIHRERLQANVMGDVPAVGRACRDTLTCASPGRARSYQ